MSRAYSVCRKCGPKSWIYQDRVAANPHCQKCGCQWPQFAQKPNAIPGDVWESRDQQNRVWKNKDRRPPKPRASNAPAGAAQRALSTVWETLPSSARQAIEQAGWQPRQPVPPPGLEGSNRSVRLSKGGAGKGKGASQAPDSSSATDDSVKALFESASDQQKELLLQCGFLEPAEPQPDLIEMCKKHMSALPPAIRELVEDPPEKPPTAFEQLNDTSRKFKTATVELRELIMKKAALQLKINKHKDLFTSMLNDMKALDTNLCSKQDQVTLLQQQLHSSVVAEVAESRLDIESALAKQIETMPLEQLEAFKARFCATIEEKTSLRKQAELPDANMREDPTEALPRGHPGDSSTREGKGRSRSRGRGASQANEGPSQG
ncbi:unnamed protein product [Symbiodinium sp. CCMP2592]|nr:unnamed protein product [Symbiodinium sp. CCMP2592]